jgi:hypothetical protein
VTLSVDPSVAVSVPVASVPAASVAVMSSAADSAGPEVLRASPAESRVVVSLTDVPSAARRSTAAL